MRLSAIICFVALHMLVIEFGIFLLWVLDWEVAHGCPSQVNTKGGISSATPRLKVGYDIPQLFSQQKDRAQADKGQKNWRP